MSFESAKKYGFISSIMMCILPIASIVISLAIFSYALGDLLLESMSQTLAMGVVGGLIIIGVLSLAVFIMFLLAQYRLSKYYKEPAIFRNILYSIIITIAYTLIISIISLLTFMSVILTTITDSVQIPMQNSTTHAAISTLLLLLAVMLITTVIVNILNGVLWWRAFNKLGEKSNIETFNTAGLLFLIGSFIPIIGYIAWIFTAKAYNQLQPTPTPTTINNITPISTPDINKIYCTFCGTENNTNNIYCKHCGNNLLQTTQTDTTTNTTTQQPEFE